MDKRGSVNDFLRNFLLFGALFFGFQYFFGRNTAQNNQKPRPVPALSQAFAGIDPGVAPGPLLNPTTGAAEITNLKAQVDANSSDDLAQWSNLRIGLIEQYVLGQVTHHDEYMFPSAIIGIRTPQTYFQDASRHRSDNQIGAQALFQEAEWQWKASLQNPDKALPAVRALEGIMTVERGTALSPSHARQFADLQIYVAKDPNSAKVSSQGVPQGGFRLVRMGDLKGTLDAPNPQGIPDRVNAYYAPTTLYKVFDGGVRLLGSHPAWSYGLAVLVFSLFVRVAMQPIYKKQYDSMKAMAALGPEMKVIQDKYKGKTDQESQMAMIRESRELQKRHGVNPTLGCGLMVIQLPILFYLVYPMIQHYEAKMELTGAQFLWIHALARPDLPLLLIYAASMFLSMRLSATPPADEMQRQQQKMMSTLFMVFPLFMVSYPAAFIMYWTTTNLLGVVFQWRLMKRADPSKNFLATLKGQGLAPVNPNADAVPPRPTGLGGDKANKSVKIQTKMPARAGAKAVANGANGSNGVHQSAPEGAVLEPSADEVARRKKKKNK